MEFPFLASTIVVAALRDQQGRQIASANIVLKPGPFKFTSAPQPLWLFAFDDLNSDLTFQSNEPYGWGNNGQAVDPETEPTNQLIIEIVATPENLPPAQVDMIDNPLGNVSDIVTIQLGKVVMV